MKKNSAEEKKEGGVISIANAKGGVGKTTVSVNLAYELAFQGYRVAMLDLDSQCDLTRVYLPEEQPLLSILDVLQKTCAPAKALIDVGDRLQLLPGHLGIGQFGFNGSEYILQKVVKGIRKAGSDFVLLDHPPSLHAAALAGYAASDYVLIVSEAEAFSVDNLAQLLTDLEAIKQAYNPALSVLGIVMNKIDLRRKLTKRTLRDCRTAFAASRILFDATLSTDTAIPNAHERRVPVRRLPWYSRSIRQFAALTEEMLERMV